MTGFGYERGALLNLATPPKFEDAHEARRMLRERLAASCRIMAWQKLDGGITSQISVRDPVEPHTYWIPPYGVAFSLMRASDVIRIDVKAQYLDGGHAGRTGVNVPGLLVHLAIHEGRPEVDAIVHAHSTYAKAFSTLGKLVDMTTQDAVGSFYNDLTLQATFRASVVGYDEEGSIANTLGKKRGIILQSHGILTVGTTLESALVFYIILADVCKVQLLADAAGQTVLVNEEAMRVTYEVAGGERQGYFKASPYFQYIEAREGAEYKC